MLTRELVAASARPMVLSILRGEDCYGYEILRRVRELSGGQIDWKEGMLYPVLHRLEAEGLVGSYWSSPNGRKRKYYQLKQPGRRALKAEARQWMVVHETLTRMWSGQPCPT